MTIEGVIVGEWRGKGVILLRHKNDTSLSFVIDEYLDPESSHPMWFAHFHLDAIKNRDDEIKKIGPLKGQVVKCSVQRSEKPKKKSLTPWVALEVEQVKGETKHWLPQFDKHLTEKQSARRKTRGRAVRRQYRKNQGEKDNLNRPWQG